jgi:hypothetical protein
VSAAAQPAAVFGKSPSSALVVLISRCIAITYAICSGTFEMKQPRENARPDLAQFPPRMTRITAAAFVSRHYFEIKPRSLEKWPLVWRELNGRAHCETAELMKVAEAKIAAAPRIRSGFRRSP